MSTQTRDLLSLATGYFPDLSSRGRCGDRGICFYSKLETLLDLSSLAAPLRRRGGSALSSTATMCTQSHTVGQKSLAQPAAAGWVHVLPWIPSPARVCAIARSGREQRNRLRNLGQVEPLCGVICVSRGRQPAVNVGNMFEPRSGDTTHDTDTGGTADVQSLVPPRTEQAAEKVGLEFVLKGHGLSRAVQALYFCHPSGASAPGGYALLTFSAASKALAEECRPCRDS